MTLTLGVALVGLLVMLLGEAWRIGGADAPLAKATAVALAMATAWPVQEGSPDAVVGLLGPLALAVTSVTVVGLVGGQTVGLLAGLARSTSAVVVAGLLVRAPGAGGRTLLDLAGHPDGRPVLVAVLLLVVAVVAVLAPILTSSLLRGVRGHAPLRPRLLEDLGRHGPLALATASTAAVAALALDVLGPSSLVVSLVPLAVLQPAVSQQRRIRLAQRQTISALGRLTEEAGLTALGHGSRVAALAVPLARDVGVEEADLADVEAAALLHDIGQVGLDRPIPGGATVEVSGKDQRRIAATGAAILARTAALSRLSTLVADVGVAHHRAVERGDVALISRVVRVVSAYDDLCGRSTRLHGGDGPVEAVERVLRNTPHDYDPEVVAALVRHLERRGVIPVGLAGEAWH